MRLRSKIKIFGKTININWLSVLMGVYCIIYFIIAVLAMMTTIGCVKTIQVKTDTISNLEYIEPQQCKIREINKKNYKTTIQGDNIVISNADMGAFLNNILDYKQAVKEYQQCSIANEEYYKSILNSILK